MWQGMRVEVRPDQGRGTCSHPLRRLIRRFDCPIINRKSIFLATCLNGMENYPQNQGKFEECRGKHRILCEGVQIWLAKEVSQ